MTPTGEDPTATDLDQRDHMLDKGGIDHEYVGLIAVDSIRDVTDEVAVLLTRKREDYGTENIDKFGEFGILVRMSDKVERLRNLMASGKEPNFESMRDTWMDIAGYAVLALELESRNGTKK